MEKNSSRFTWSNRDDFGPNSGIVLFERPEGVIERADRLEANEELPFIIIDAAETSVEIPILQFPLWVAFAGSDNEIYDDCLLYTSPSPRDTNPSRMPSSA